MRAFLEPIQERRRRFETEIKDMDGFLESSQKRANEEAGKLMEKVREAIKI
jgi:tryptophanyl-tRNA synthetase